MLTTPTSDQISEAVLCHLSFIREEGGQRGAGRGREECEVCRVERDMVEYGKKLFSGYNDSLQ